VVLGVRRPLGLRASGRSADGTILAEPSAPVYIGWARERIEEGRAAAGRTDPHRVTVFVKGRIDANRRHAREVVAGMLLSESVAAQLTPLDREAELAELRALGDPATVAPRIPDDLLDQLTATGTAEQVIASLHAIAETDVDTIVFAPIGPDPNEQLRLLADTIAPSSQAERTHPHGVRTVRQEARISGRVHAPHGVALQRHRRDRDHAIASPGRRGRHQRQHRPDLIHQTRGGRWPTEPVTEDYNFVDLVWHELEFRERDSFTYAVYNTEPRYLGCCYLYPMGRRTQLTEQLLDFDIDVSWWVTPTAYEQGYYRTLYDALQHWLADEFPFWRPYYSNAQVPR